jgi:hypothetical protein
MSDWSKVTVHLNEDGGLADVDVEGEIDRDNLTEERREAPPIADAPETGTTIWPLG